MHRFTHIVEDQGQHYIVDESSGEMGPVVGFQTIATALIDGKILVAITDYHRGTNLEPNTVYETTVNNDTV